MEILKRVECKDRLPDKEGNYFCYQEDMYKVLCGFNFKQGFTGTHITHWLEPIEVKLDSEQIYPINERLIDLSFAGSSLDFVITEYCRAIKALEAAELKNIQLQEQLGTGLTKDFFRQEVINLSNKLTELTTSADERYNNAKDCCTKFLKHIGQPMPDYVLLALKIAAYGNKTTE